MRTASASQPLNTQKSSLSGLEDSANGLWLFETPADLICPITHELFKDPVINAAGQVYERAAIEHHLTQRTTDPVTNAPLNSPHLIPVYTLKSRSQEFREHVAKACVDQACSTRSCEVSVRYLRRAAELVSGCEGLKVPGLCTEVVEFLQANPSSSHDAVALRIFADGLRKAGYADQATQIYLRLVEHGHDRSQQAAALRQCLKCLGSEQQGCSEKSALPFLAHFLENQQTFDATGLLDLLHEAQLPEPFILQLCELLLTRRMQSELESQQEQGVATAGLQLNDLLFQYARLRFGLLQQQVDEVVSLTAPKSDTVEQPGTTETGDVKTDSQKLANGVVHDAKPRFTRKAVQQVSRFLTRHRTTLASTVFMVMSVVGGRGNAAPVRLARASSALLLVHCSTRR